MADKRIEVDADLLSVIQNSITAGVSDGVKRAMIEYDKTKKSSSKTKYDKRLRNTGLLLKNYRNFKEHCKNAIYEDLEEIKIKEDSDVIEIFDKIYNMEDDGAIVESILKAKERTLIIIKHIDSCINFYEYKAKISENNEFQRRVEVLKKLYINEEEKSFEEIAEELFVSTKTVNRDRKKATEDLAPLVFGVDGIFMS